MLLEREVGKKSLTTYEELIGKEKFDEITQLSKKLKNVRVLHLGGDSSFTAGENLYAILPLMKELGLQVQWLNFQEPTSFQKVVRKFHYGMDGKKVELNLQEKEEFLRTNRSVIDDIQNKYDIVIVHDLSLIAAVEIKEKSSAKWAWYYYSSLSQPTAKIWQFLNPYFDLYDMKIFIMRPKMEMSPQKVFLMPLSIDPLNLKNTYVSPDQQKEILQKYNIDHKRPILLQVSRFSHDRDPIGVIDSYQLSKKRFPNIQLVFVTFIGHDDLKSWYYFEKVVRHAGEDYDIHFVTNMHGAESRDVNSLQRSSDIIIKKSIEDEFGLVVTEALWKEKPVIASNLGGLVLQVVDGINGYLVDNDVLDWSEKLNYLIGNPDIAKEFGQRGKEYVRENFLLTRQLKDYLVLFSRLLGV